MVLDTFLLDTRHYKLLDQGESRTIQRMECRPLLYSGLVAIEKGAFGSPSTEVANFTDFTIDFRSDSDQDLIAQSVWGCRIHRLQLSRGG